LTVGHEPLTVQLYVSPQDYEVGSRSSTPVKADCYHERGCFARNSYHRGRFRLSAWPRDSQNCPEKVRS